MKHRSLLVAVALILIEPGAFAQYVAPWEDSVYATDIDTNAVIHVEDPAPFTPFALSPPGAPSVSVSFQGLDDNNQTIPPNANGAVGLSHVVTMLNTQVRISNRSGTTNYSTTTLPSWWSGAGSFASLSDPRIVYDPYENRWIAAVSADPVTTNGATFLAVSQGADPTGAWYYQKVPADTNHVLWADYPCIGFNKSWIAVSCNMYTNGGGFSHARMCVFNKTNAYAGGSTRTIFDLSSSVGSTIVPAITYSTSEARIYCLQTYNPALAVDPADVFGFLRIHVISGSVGSPSFTPTMDLPSTDPWAASFATDTAPQTNSSVNIYTADSRIQNVVLRNNYLWAAQTIFLPRTTPTRSAIQWWQINTSGDVQQVARIDDPAGVNFYAFPSISVNRFNDALIGFTSFSSNQYATASYAFRAFSDQRDQFRANAILKAGEGVYYKTGAGKNRWGDFNSAMVDPVNDTDFWTLIEYAATPVGSGSNNGDGRWGVWWGNIIASMPSNDNFANATSLSGVKGTNTATLFRATKETSEPNHAGSAGGRSIWFSWTPATNGPVSFDTLRTTQEIDTLLAVYTGTNVASLTLVASNDEAGRTRNLSYVYFNAVAGTTYKIAVDAKSPSSETGDVITLYWEQYIAPSFAVEPFDLHILAGDPLVLLSLALGQPSPTYQWKLDGVNISGATYANYTNSSIATNQGGVYTVTAANSSGSITSSGATITVHPSATATLDGFEYLSGDKFKFVVTGIPGYNYVVQATSDFTNWTSLNTNTSSFSYTNSVTTNFPYRFFRSIY